ncbi:hypothetical protein [Herbaspirillum sp. YR522]|uniref:hypothetical protein n=1 Tax=Herbaspirillum sp. YR522 TaxID=1144342 RepID=UPI00026F5C23|nr:hypothetical protein [Herbaspirillum sp. YR522]EJN09294.1 hypothetical protein PMI40_00740 [Herbaspirillum sp. YR522]
MSHSNKWLLAASAVLLVSACATPEERMAKLQIKQQQLELRAQQINERRAARMNDTSGTGAVGDGSAQAVTDLDTPLGNVIKALASCDASLPATLKQFVTQLAPQVPVVAKANGASLGVADRAIPGRSSVPVAGQAQVMGVPVSGFFDEATIIGGQPEKISWGFYSPASVATVSSVLGARIAGYKQVRQDVGGAMLRMDIYDGRNWRRTTRFDYFRNQSKLAGERVFAIDVSRDPAFPGTRVSCSVRGTQLKELLPVLRPDLG